MIGIIITLRRVAGYAAALADDPVKNADMAVALKRMEATGDPQEIYATNMAFHQTTNIASCLPALVVFAVPSVAPGD